MNHAILTGHSKKKYLDDFIQGMDALSEKKILPGKLDQIRSIAQRMHYQKSISLNPLSGLVSKEDLQNLKQGLPFEEELEIGTQYINNYIDIFDCPISEGVWIRYLVGLQKEIKSKTSIKNLDHSHLKDPEHAYNYLANFNIKSNRIEQHVLGPFITEHLQNNYGLMSDMVKDYRGSWILVYTGKVLTAREKGFLSKPKIETESKMYFVCSDTIKKDLHVLYPKKEILAK